MNDVLEQQPSRIAPASERLLGSIVGDRYLLKREAGRGGVAVVYIADHLFTGKTVAVKMVLPDLASTSEARVRLLREARNLGRVDHPWVVALLDAGVSASGPYLVMERLRGRSLEGLVAARGKLFIEDVIAVARFAGEALEAIHASEIVHCDIKPGNMFVYKDPKKGKKSMKLIDFGISRAIGDEREETIAGTPIYMSPEQLTGGTITPASDIYSLGVSLYECLTGSVPFFGSLEHVIARTMTMSPDPIAEIRPEVPRPLAQLVEVCLARDPVDRFENGADFLRALDAAESDIGMGRAGDTLPPPDESRREHDRAQYGAAIELWVGDRVIEGRSEDVSEGGFLIIADGSLEAGTELVVRFPLPTSGLIVTANARVQWCRARDVGKSAMGIELVDTDDTVRQSISEYVEKSEHVVEST